MYELVTLNDTDQYIRCPARIGLIRTGPGEACLIDSGGDRDAGKRVKRILDEQGLTLRAIYNTHSHADHIGGNRYLSGQYACPIYAPGIEQAFTLHPVLEPGFLYGGFPPGELRHKFLMAQESDALPLRPEALPYGVSVIDLPGHSFDMVGFRTEKGVVFLADCLVSAQTLAKYRVSFLVDVAKYLETLEKVKKMAAAVFVPSHAEATENIAPLAQLNIDMVYEVADAIIKLCAEPAAFDTILRGAFDRFGLAMTVEQHALVGSTVRSYLTWLTGAGRAEMLIMDNTLMWRAV